MREPSEEQGSEKSSTGNRGDRSEISPLLSEWQFRGLALPPAFPELYEKLPPEVMAQILQMWQLEQQQQHKLQDRQFTIKEKLVDAQIRDLQQERSERRLGQIFGFLIGTVCISAGAVTAVLGSEIGGGFIGSAGVIGLVYVFVVGRQVPKELARKERKDERDK